LARQDPPVGLSNHVNPGWEDPLKVVVLNERFRAAKDWQVPLLSIFRPTNGLQHDKRLARPAYSVHRVNCNIAFSILFDYEYSLVQEIRACQNQWFWAVHT